MAYTGNNRGAVVVWNKLIMDCIITVVCLFPFPSSLPFVLRSFLSSFLPSIPDVSISVPVNEGPEFHLLSIAFPASITLSGPLTQILEFPEVD